MRVRVFDDLDVSLRYNTREMRRRASISMRGSDMTEENAHPDARPGDDRAGRSGSVADFLARAHEARSSGDDLLSMYLYLAAFERSSKESNAPAEDALLGIKEAWALACSAKERSLAEYIFEKMEPYLSHEELKACTEMLQELALDRLEECGLSREELEGMAQMISEDILGAEDPSLHIEHISTQRIPGGSLSVAQIKGTLPAAVSKRIEESSEPAEAQADAEGAATDEVQLELQEEPLDYSNLAGYGAAIEAMRSLGIGMAADEEFKDLVDLLNSRHGLTQMPAMDSLLFRSPVREDANRFVMATIGELGLPAVHMRMEENIQGLPVLCISARADALPKQSSLQDAFKNGGVLVLEDLDLWTSPSFDLPEEGPALFMMQLTRGAREAVEMIRTSVDNPEVYVFATCSTEGAVDAFYLDSLEPITVVDIDYPTAEERVEIWMDIAHRHPSLRGINKAELVRFSANMPRFDIYMAARDAVEEAYKAALSSKRYVPVTRDNVFDKLAAYQPLESDEYTQLEDEVLKDFRRSLDDIDSLLGND